MPSKPLDPRDLAIRLSCPVRALRLDVGERGQLAVDVVNAGSTLLDSEGPAPISLSYHWRAAGGQVVVHDGVRTPLRPPLCPGEARNIPVEVVAPPHEGLYQLVVTMVQEGCCWFEDVLPEFPLFVEATISPGASAMLLAGSVFTRQPALAKARYVERLVHRGVSRPLMIIVETSSLCTNRCMICAQGLYSPAFERLPAMPMELFAKLLDDYAAIGGGPLSLTPHPGEVFLDPHLGERLRLMEAHPSITALSVTTNAVPLEGFTDDELAYIINRFDRLHVSLYGLDADEYRCLSGRDHFARVVANVRRILSVVRAPSAVRLGFRFLDRHSDDEVREWIRRTFEADLVFGHTNEYFKWSNAIDATAPLPRQATWLPPKENRTQCLRPLVALQVYSNGDVSFCPCADGYRDDDLVLGSMARQSLGDLYNSPKVARLWDFESSTPDFCRRCSIHLPMAELERDPSIFEDPIGFLGG